jgi:hypothetical protein
LRTKAALIEAVVEGVAEPPLEGDLLGALETLVGALSPKLATLGDAESGEDAVDRLLREAVAAARAQPGPTAGGPEREALRRLPAEAILALARVLSGPVTTRYRVDSSSTAGAYYCSVSKVCFARPTLSRIYWTEAVQTNGLGFWLRCST